MAGHIEHDDTSNMKRAPVVTRGVDRPGNPDDEKNILFEARRRASAARRNPR